MSDSAERVVLALGPTNTGKTHRALVRLREHDSGMIGLPLRLLAREVYDTLTADLGEEAVALVTGEEKRVPRAPRYWVATVEAMPLDVPVDFLAVDEVQLAAHPERGHVFTDRLLHARGRLETWFLGSDAVASILRLLVPAAEVRSFPRYSALRHLGEHTLGGLPRRSAIVAFSAPRVYELASRVRARRGGAAIVLGALSPRARNAQVAMYQAGEVDYLVATDAIGMGLNLDLDHVALAELDKFDGREARPLEVGELAQIVGRAGRYQREGSFGTLVPGPPLPGGLTMMLEEHRVPPLRSVYYRSSSLDYSSVEGLLRSLRTPPPGPWGRSVRHAEDAAVLVRLGRSVEVSKRATTEERLRLLWDVCQLPDYRRLMLDEHARLCEEIFLHIVDEGGLSPSYLDAKLRRAERHHSDIDSVTAAIATSRTWTYATGRPGWVPRADEFRERARNLEDRLSDVLHQLLTSEFVERKRAISLPGARSEKGARKDHPFSVLGALLEERLRVEEPNFEWEKVLEARHEDFTLGRDGNVVTFERVVGRLTRGKRVSEPEVRPVDEELPPGVRGRLARRLHAFGRDVVRGVVPALGRLEGSGPSAALRGILYQLHHGLGAVDARSVEPLLGALSESERVLLGRAGVVLGERTIYAKESLRGEAFRTRFLLHRNFFGPTKGGDGSSPRPGLRWGDSDASALALGYRRLGSHAIRVDLVEDLLRRKGEPKEKLRNLLGSMSGAPRKEAERIVKALFGERSTHSAATTPDSE